MAETLQQRIRDRWLKAKQQRVNYDARWERQARLLRPSAAGFNTVYAPGQSRGQDIFDSTGQQGLPRFAAALNSLVTPENAHWHHLKSKSQSARTQRSQAFYYEVKTRLFAARYSAKANFSGQVGEVYMSVGLTGNGVLYVGDAKPGLRYVAIHMSELWFAQDHNGLVDTVFWAHEYTNRQAAQRWPDKLPAIVKAEMEKEPDKKHRYVKCVFPRAERDTRRRDAKNMPFASVTFIDEGGSDGAYAVVEETGYRTFPFAVARHTTSPQEVYASSPAEEAFADILTVNEMSKTSLRYGQRVADPTYMAVDADGLDPFANRPGAVNYGYLSPDGTDRIKQLDLKGKPEFSLELMNQRRQSINNAFLITLFQVLVETGSDRMTATEVMQRVQEKGALLAPIGGKLRNEFLGPMIQRELDIMFNSNAFADLEIPDEVIQDGGEYDVEYDSPLMHAMRAQEGVAIMRTLETAVQLASVDPTVMKRVNTGRVLERVTIINGAPPDILFSPEEMAAKAEQDSQQQQIAQALEAAPVIADTAKSLAQAQQIAGQQVGVV